MISYKVMRYDPETNEVVSGADSRLRFKLEADVIISMPGQGVWMGLNKEYVEAHYGDIHDYEALIQLEFDPKALIEGNLTDREPEFTTKEARVVSFEIRGLEPQPWSPRR